jgi:hypothetical protein
MLPRDASVVGQREDNLAYFCVCHAWYVVEADGRVLPRTPKSPLLRLEKPAWFANCEEKQRRFIASTSPL